MYKKYLQASTNNIFQVYNSMLVYIGILQLVSSKTNRIGEIKYQYVM